MHKSLMYDPNFTRKPLAQRAVIVTKIKGGALHFGKATISTEGVTDADTAIHLLLAGETIYLKQYGPLVTEVQRNIEKALGRIE